MPRRHTSDTPPQPPPDAPEDALELVDLNTMAGIISDAYYDYFRTRALFLLSAQYLTTYHAHPNDAPMVEPGAIAFVLEDGLEWLARFRDTLEDLEIAVNTLLQEEGSDIASHLKGMRRSWARYRRWWAACDPYDRELVLRCMRLVQRGPSTYTTLRHCFEQLEGKKGGSTGGKSEEGSEG